MTLKDRATNIAEDFSYLDDWEDRYAHIIDLGKSNPSLAPKERIEDNRVRGCASQVWMIISDSDAGALTIRAESDAMIVSGLIGILVTLYSGATAREILDFDATAYLNEIGVTGALSAQRSNGLNAMLQRIQETAASRLTN